jgi:hypothetical protein
MITLIVGSLASAQVENVLLLWFRQKKRQHHFHDPEMILLQFLRTLYFI